MLSFCLNYYFVLLAAAGSVIVRTTFMSEFSTLFQQKTSLCLDDNEHNKRSSIYQNMFRYVCYLGNSSLIKVISKIFFVVSRSTVNSLSRIQELWHPEK